MTPTVHKLLIHGPAIVQTALLPIGHLSEEAQEARNKDFKGYREQNSRKFTREQCLRDILNTMLISSDPLITSFRRLPPKKLKQYPIEAIQLLSSPDIPIKNSDNRYDSEEEKEMEKEEEEEEKEGDDDEEE